MSIEEEIEIAEKNLKEMKTWKRSSLNKILFPVCKEDRKERDDKGKKRAPYKGNLPPRYRQYLNGANKRGLSFELSVEEFETILQYPCVYCGSSFKIGIDRKESDLGYTLDNSQSCCTTCNMMKFRYSEEDFLYQVMKIYTHRIR